MKMEPVMRVSYKRFENNPLICPQDLEPGTSGFAVVGVLNPGAFRQGNRLGLILRVAESALSAAPAAGSCPVGGEAPWSPKAKSRFKKLADRVNCFPAFPRSFRTGQTKFSRANAIFSAQVGCAPAGRDSTSRRRESRPWPLAIWIARPGRALSSSSRGPRCRSVAISAPK